MADLRYSEAVVLAGGFGTRLKSVITDMPKPMAPVAGRPFLEHVLDELITQGVSRTVLAVSYKAEMVIEHFGASYKGMEILYSVEADALGTGGGIRQAVGMTSGDAAFIVNGDTLFRAGLKSMEESQLSSGVPLVVGLVEMRDFDRYGTVSFDAESGVLAGFHEKQPCEHGFINGGVYLVHKKLWDRRRLAAKFSFEKDVLEAWVGEGNFRAVPFNAYFIDIGIPSDYEKSQTDLA